jgi:hypothetical protein
MANAFLGGEGGMCAHFKHILKGDRCACIAVRSIGVIEWATVVRPTIVELYIANLRPVS